MERVDLDGVELRMQIAQGESSASALKALDELVLDFLPALVAELQAARKVVEVVRPWLPLVCVDCYEAGCDGENEPCGCEDGCHAKDQAFRDALAAYDQAVGQPATADQPPGEVR